MAAVSSELSQELEQKEGKEKQDMLESSPAAISSESYQKLHPELKAKLDILAVPMKAQEIESPDILTCPISLEVFKRPVLASDGYIYEYYVITELFERGTTISPMTQTLFPNQNLSDVHPIQSASHEFLQSLPKMQEKLRRDEELKKQQESEVQEKEARILAQHKKEVASLKTQRIVAFSAGAVLAAGAFVLTSLLTSGRKESDLETDEAGSPNRKQKQTKEN